jgi:putative ABC transport system ATP-binding protein
LPAIIEAKNITKEYQLDDLVARILKGVSLKIEKGEHMAIMGPSGSGKSTLMHILGLLDRPTAGEYYFNGRNTKELTDDELARLRNSEIGFVFQSFNLLNRTTVLENVRLPLTYWESKDVDKNARAKKIIESVGLSHRLNNWPGQLSGGEQQRVAIARALVNTPSIIFADEPTGNLDSKSGEQIMKLLADLHAQGNTVVVVTHDMDIARHAQRVVHLKDGLVEKDEKVR